MALRRSFLLRICLPLMVIALMLGLFLAFGPHHHKRTSALNGQLPVSAPAISRQHPGVPIDELGQTPLAVVRIYIDSAKLPPEQVISGHTGQTVAFRVNANRVGTLSLSGFNLSTKTIPGKTVELRASIQQLSTYTLTFDGKRIAVLTVTK